jgi:hypothetical protein
MILLIRPGRVKKSNKERLKTNIKGGKTDRETGKTEGKRGERVNPSWPPFQKGRNFHLHFSIPKTNLLSGFITEV